MPADDQTRDEITVTTTQSCGDELQVDTRYKVSGVGVTLSGAGGNRFSCIGSGFGVSVFGFFVEALSFDLSKS